MSLRMKVKLNSVRRHAGDPGSIEYFLAPVYGDSEENKRWSKWTPNGAIQFTVTNPECPELALGKEYFVDIHDAEQPPQAPEGEPAP